MIIICKSILLLQVPSRAHGQDRGDYSPWRSSSTQLFPDDACIWVPGTKATSTRVSVAGGTASWRLCSTLGGQAPKQMQMSGQHQIRAMQGP